MIPICIPLLAGKELEYVTDHIKTNWISSQGKDVEGFDRGFGEYCGCRRGISTTNGTTALNLTLTAAGVKKGDKIIMHTSTMIATSFAVAYRWSNPYKSTLNAIRGT